LERARLLGWRVESGSGGGAERLAAETRQRGAARRLFFKVARRLMDAAHGAHGNGPSEGTGGE
jgi:hypothetical protein